VRPGLLALIDQLGDTPAFVLGRRTDVLAANRMARLLLAVGEIVLGTEAMTFPGDPDQMLIVFLAEPGSPSRHALDLMAVLDPAGSAFPRSGTSCVIGVPAVHSTLFCGP
jgi:hypothetical protein